jgi:hypothetical protein
MISGWTPPASSYRRPPTQQPRAVRAECLEAALAEEADTPAKRTHGVRGGVSARDRDRIREAARIAQEPPPEIERVAGTSAA